MISVVIPHVPGEEHDARLKKCLDSMSGYGELIIVTNQLNTIGFTKAVNIGMRAAKGDFIAVVNNDIEVVKGSLSDLCKPGVVTSPYLNGRGQDFWGCFFVVPREIYEKVGELDEQFYLYCSDTDYVMRLKQNQFQCLGVPECEIKSVGGRTTMTVENRTQIDNEDTAKFIAKWGKRPDACI